MRRRCTPRRRAVPASRVSSPLNLIGLLLDAVQLVPHRGGELVFGIGLGYWIRPGATSRPGSSRSNHHGRLPARSLPARLPDDDDAAPSVQGCRTSGAATREHGAVPPDRPGPLRAGRPAAAGSLVAIGSAPVGAGNCVTLCDLGIFADQAAEPVPPDNRIFAFGAGACERPAAGLCCSVRCGR